MSHLTDEQIQDFIDNNLDPSGDIAGHLHSCKKCQQEVENYKALFAGLNTEPEMTLSADFADMVMDQLPEVEFESSASTQPAKIRESFVFGMVVCIMMITGLYFLDVFSFIGTQLSSLALSDLGTGEKFNTAREFLSGYGKLPLMIFFILLTMGFVGGLDKFIKSRRDRTGLRSFMV
ncbi:MAG: hypothetical protein KAR42_10520 [candidate division Zixibacteria bacterium]|nr:hypothetical protein [candidate division Zixibacteria bacterium]